MNNDQIRAEFEAWAIQNGLSVPFSHGRYYWGETEKRWQVWQAAYQAGRKAAEEVGCVDGCKIKRSVKEFTEGMSDERR